MILRDDQVALRHSDPIELRITKWKYQAQDRCQGLSIAACYVFILIKRNGQNFESGTISRPIVAHIFLM
ncbi:hypothetical protein TSA66_15225 [Noviherbaspirillum autotrophicum]|uniref:Uncharacterized protein n=1 Tax=Noviherbaspirillum autotrophicum TaxID=709839 RepID=A0A0C1Y435_9BURK|nr:hypothetical protein TSA66_15225 [Noviherbaspirillum autotrophicum]